LLTDVGIDTDSSIYPLYSNDYFSCEKANRSPYWPSFEDTNKVGKQNKIYEIPVTCGFNRSSTFWAQKFHRLMEQRPFCWFRINGLFWHTLLLRKIYLSPELCTARDMNRLIDKCLKQKQTVFHMYLHSSSFLEQITGLNNELHARENMCQRIKQVVEHLSQKADIRFCTLSQAKQQLVSQEKNND